MFLNILDISHDLSLLMGDLVGGVLVEKALWPERFHNIGEPSNVGAGRPVLFIPGYRANDATMNILRLRIALQGFAVVPSGIDDRNTADYRFHRKSLMRALKKTADKTGQPVSVVGWSMGGRFAFSLAAEEPQLVRSIVTLGTPLRKLSAEKLALPLMPQPLINEMSADVKLPDPTIPLSVVIASLDGVVKRRDSMLTASELAIGPRENVIIRTWHTGMSHSQKVAQLLTRRLCQEVHSWQPDAQALSKTVH